MKISVITPTYNSIDSLKQTHKSIVDQKHAEFEHIIIDGNSTDGTIEWLKSEGNQINQKRGSSSVLYPSLDESIYSPNPDKSFTYISESDNGIYDALNKGFKNASGDILAWLNSDEQYLLNTLETVTDFFAKHPDVDILFGGMLMVDEYGELLAFRKAMPMRLTFIKASYLYNFSCAMFFRKELFEKLEGFDNSFKASGDMDFIYRAMCSGIKTKNINRFLSTFIYNDENLSSTKIASDEHNMLTDKIGIKNKPLNAIINFARIAEKLLTDGYKCTLPLNYSIHIDDTKKRKKFSFDRASAKWPDHDKPYILNHRNKDGYNQ